MVSQQEKRQDSWPWGRRAGQADRLPRPLAKQIPVTDRDIDPLLIDSGSDRWWVGGLAAVGGTSRLEKDRPASYPTCSQAGRQLPRTGRQEEEQMEMEGRGRCPRPPGRPDRWAGLPPPAS